MKIIPYPRIHLENLFVDAIYEGGSRGKTGDDAICKLVPGVGNQGGFRAAGRGEDKKLVVLYTSGEDKNWPDTIDHGTGQFVYYGDNKTPGHELHDTRRSGNRILRRTFELLHASPARRDLIPPFFVFAKSPTPQSARSVQFKGLAVPGFAGVPATEDLMAIWKTSDNQRFQNYRSIFTILDAPTVERIWIDALLSGNATDGPDAWNEWVTTGRYRSLVSEPTTVIRSVAQQTPDSELKQGILRSVFMHFRNHPIGFERFAARVFQLQDQRVIIDEVTRGVIDGGRDAVGRYRLGLVDDPVYAEFALEAKCYSPPLPDCTANTVGVKEISRLISRLRHRQFGVLVTTSAVSRQAYQEVRDDRHPIVFISGRDLVDTLIAAGLNTPSVVKAFLQTEFPLKDTGEGR